MPYKDIEKKRKCAREYEKKRRASPEYRARKKKYSREYWEKNRDKLKQYNREYRKKRRIEDSEYRERERKRCEETVARMRIEAPWILYWRAAKTRCTNPNQRGYKNYGGKGIRMLLTKLETQILWIRDGADQLEHPSLDRINPKGDYHFGNCRFIELSENIIRAIYG